MLNDKYEIRFCLIGHDNVGKKSLCGRLAKLKSTETKQLEYEDKIMSDEDMDKLLDQKDCKFKSLEEIILHERERLRIREITSFAKVYTVNNIYMEVKPYIVSKAKPILHSTNYHHEELENQDTAHRLNFDPVKEDLNEIFSSESPADEVYHLLLFVYDLTNFDSYLKAKAYYEMISSSMNLEVRSDVIVAFIANKVDAKKRMSAEEKVHYSSFFIENGFSPFEVSTLTFFNFERLFERLFLQLFDFKEEFQTQFFKEKFSNVLFLRHT